MNPSQVLSPKQANPRTMKYSLSTIPPVLLVAAIMIAVHGPK